jgi:hypothetical protein
MAKFEVRGYEDSTPACKASIDFLFEVSNLLVQKNKAYGDSAANPSRVFSRASAVEQILVRVDDKLSRIRTTGFDPDASEDTVQDLVGYLALLRGALKANGTK